MKSASKVQLRRDSISELFGEHFFAPITLLDVQNRDFMSVDRGLDWQFLYDPFDETFVLPLEPSPTPRLSRVSIFVAKHGGKLLRNDLMSARDWSQVVSVPIKMLCVPPKKYHLYNVSFGFTNESACPFDLESGSAIAVGYYGITGRHFLKRFQEHASDAAKGKGHLLHRVWNQMLTQDFDFTPAVRFAGSADTLDEIYDLEETAVKQTLNPLGLNVIPGGREGIRFLHRLRAVENLDLSPDERDCVLERLESGKKSSHYRTGHMRNLPTGKVTWVRPCWINLPSGFQT